MILAAAALLLQVSQVPEYARAESLLAAGDTRHAYPIAHRIASRHPDDPAALMLLGRVDFARPVVGRYPALEAFRRAAALSPRDPEPLYWQMKVGLYLGSDEGDRIAREALLQLFRVAPDYRDAWATFNTLYRDDGIRRRADLALAAHPDDPRAQSHRAELALDLGAPGRADSLAALALARSHPDVPAYLLRAEAAFQDHRDSAGFCWYDSALTYADLDSTGVIWAGIWMIATPVEVARHDSVVPEDAEHFYETFWATRDPNLFTAVNERIAEHFRRLLYARRYYALLHPQALRWRSARYRALERFEDVQLLQSVAEAVGRYPGGATDPLSVQARAFSVDGRTIGDSAGGGKTLYYLADLNGKGLLYVRHGPPDRQLLHALDPGVDGGAGDNLWIYDGPRGPEYVHLSDPNGEPYLAPFTEAEALYSKDLLTTDRSSLPAPLTVRGWRAVFKSDVLGLTDVYYKMRPESAAVVLWDAADDPVVRVAGSGLLAVTVPPGAYREGVDVDSGPAMGRHRANVTVRAFSAVDLNLSSLALAPGDSVADRETVLRGMPRDLVYPAGRALAAYAEIYGLHPDAEGRSHYRVRYSFERVRSLASYLLGRGSPVAFEFDREVPWASTVQERLVIEPGRIPPGRYRMSLSVTDVPSNVKSEAVALEIEIR